MILNGRRPSAGDSVVTRIDKNGPWGEVDNLKWSSHGGALAGARDRKRQDLLRSVLGDDVPDLGEKLRLAGLCKNSHQWDGHPVSLQVKDGLNWRCQECRRLRKIEQSQRKQRNSGRRWHPELRGLLPTERRKLYKRKLVQELRAKGLTARGTAPTRADGGTAKGERNEAMALVRAMEHAMRPGLRPPSVARLVMNEQHRYWKQNPEAKKEHNRQWSKYIYAWKYKCNPSFRRHECQRNSEKKARNRGNHTVKLCQKDIDQRYAEFGNQCAFCGSANRLIVEHFIPRSKGGPHAIGNILPACHRCNTSKSNHDPEEWYRRQAFFTESRWRKILRVLDKRKGSVAQLPLL
jgi:hypothetical protein